MVCGGPIVSGVDTRSVHVEPRSSVGILVPDTSTHWALACTWLHNQERLRLQPNSEVWLASLPTHAHTSLPMNI